MLRKADDESKYVGTFAMASFDKKTYVIAAKTWRKNYKKYAIVFASTQFRITRLRKYPIDPKAYPGRWSSYYPSVPWLACCISLFAKVLV